MTEDDLRELVNDATPKAEQMTNINKRENFKPTPENYLTFIAPCFLILISNISLPGKASFNNSL